MSDIIQLLPDSVANQIAAGEVIQRPANVVKELMENSIDASATKIDVYIVDAGRTAIQVVDNGVGMSENDARLSFERHATSKIRHANDLYTLRTMGFRGEALPSIAAVAMVDMHTRREEDELGVNISIAASHVESQRLCACPVGCNINVQNLFFNIPARRKFLKSNTTEMNNIVAAFSRIALVYPNIEFSLHSNDSEILHLAPSNTHRRIADLFGKHLSQSLLPIDAKTSICNISGFVGEVASAKKKCSNQYFFVNGRYMRHAYFAKAVLSAYERLLPTGFQVPYFVYLDVDPTTIDVNIHPAKTEVKFENEQSIWQILSAAVREAVGIFSELPTIDFDTKGKLNIPIFNHTQPLELSRELTLDMGRDTTREPSQTDDDTLWGDLFNKKTPTIQPVSCYQHRGQYIVTSSSTGIMLIDQHRAHTRILYERYIHQLNEDKPVSQQLLFPEAIRFNSHSASLTDTIISEMERLGFGLTPLGADNYAINSVPDGIAGLNPSKLLADIIEDILTAGTTTIDDIHHTLALSLARKASIPIGQVLTHEEMDSLLRDLLQCENSNLTPDGKKIYYIVSDSEILRYFT